MAKTIQIKQYPGDLTNDGIVGTIYKVVLYGPPNTEFQLYTDNNGVFNTVKLSYSGKCELDFSGVCTLTKVCPTSLTVSDTPIIIQAILEAT